MKKKRYSEDDRMDSRTLYVDPGQHELRRAQCHTCLKRRMCRYVDSNGDFGMTAFCYSGMVCGPCSVAFYKRWLRDVGLL